MRDDHGTNTPRDAALAEHHRVDPALLDDLNRAEGDRDKAWDDLNLWRDLAREAAACAEQAEAALERVRALLSDPDDVQWWEVVPYMDPPNQDEAVEVAVIAVDRLRAALNGGGA